MDKGVGLLILFDVLFFPVKACSAFSQPGWPPFHLWALAGLGLGTSFHQGAQEGNKWEKHHFSHLPEALSPSDKPKQRS